MLDHLSYSSRRTIKTCPRKFWLYKYKRLEQKTKSLGMLQGGHFSDLLEAHYADEWDEAHESDLDKAIANASSIEERNELVAGRIVAEEMAAEYKRRYEEPSDLHREIEFSIPIPTSELTDDGYVDGLALDGSYFVEDKLLNGRFWGENNVAQLELNAQVTGYFYALYELGYAPEHCKYRVNLKPQVHWRKGRRKDKSDADTPETYRERVREKIEEDGDSLFREYVLTRSSQDLDDYLRDMVFYTGLYERMDKDGFFPKNDDACTDYGGCEFLPLCTGKADAMQHLQIREKDGR